MTNHRKRHANNSRIMLPGKPITLRALAEYLQLSPATVSVVVNDSPAAKAIPERTKGRVLAAARKLDYRPNFFARSLSLKRGFTVGILTPELSDGYHTLVMSGVGDYLMREGYFYFSAHHRHKPDLVDEYPRLLIGRGAEGIIAIDTALQYPLPIPAVAVAGHRKIKGITNIVLDHRRAAELVLCHLHQLGHRHIAFMRGQPFSSDSDDRWQNTVLVARELGIEIHPELTIALERDLSSPALGYPVVGRLLAQRRKFTAVVSFNDMAAIGVIRALRDATLGVPDDVSVVGFDDILFADYSIPRLTTIRQPLHEMGEMAARILIERLQGHRVRRELAVAPELVVRETTAAPKVSVRHRQSKVSATQPAMSGKTSR